MGQKVNPILFRITGEQRKWSCDWYAKDKKSYEDGIFEDLVIIKYLERCEISQYVGDIIIERKSNTPHLTIKTNKSVAVLGKKGSNLEKIQKDLKQMINKTVVIAVVELKRPNLNAKILGHGIATQIKKRIAYKRAIKSTIESAMRAGALGIKICIGGRLNGAEIARSETFKDGSMPLHTIRSNIDYATVTAFTIYGAIGIKVWVYTGISSVKN